MTAAERAAIHVAAAQTAAEGPPMRPEMAEKITRLLHAAPTARPQAVTRDGEPPAAVAS